MRVSCPACQTEYEVPDAALTGRPRKLRCGQCEHQWEVAPLAPAPAGAAATATASGEPVTGIDQPPPAMTAEPPPAPVRLPEPSSPAMIGSQHIFPVPDPLDTAATDRFDPKSTAKLTYGDPGYEFPRNIPVTPPAYKLANPWLVSILILLIAATMVWIERVHIMHVWPPSTRLFDAISGVFQQFLPRK